MAAQRFPPRRRLGALRPKVQTRIHVGIAFIAVLGVLSMLYVYRGLSDVAGHLTKLEKVEAPFSIAAIEMEKNAGEYALGVLQYIAQPMPGIRTEAENDSADFVRYHASYMRLATSERKRELGRHLAEDHRSLVATGNRLMAKRDQLDAAFARTADLLEEIDVIADGRMTETAPSREPDRSARLAAIANIEAEAAEIGFWMATFERRPTALATQRLLEKLDELDGALAGYRQLPLGEEERKLAAEVDARRVRVRAGVDALLAGEDAMRAMEKEFVRVQVHMDDVFDEEVEPLAARGLTEPQELADRTAMRVLTTLRYAIPLYAMVALTVGLLLFLAIARPLRRLESGTRAIGAGNLDHRIPAEGDDEFDRLARQFNQMVERLQDSTVSRRLLEESEQKLRSTVADLRQEIAERQHAERERESLQVELRRSEAMAAMGSLMAGVAHEVRNSLFGISSTLDAMEASEDGRDERRREVLRREVNRLNKLMTDLLEYGRPPSSDFSEGQIGKLVAEAIRVCTPAAEAASVTLVNAACGCEAALRMNHGRLLQVFVNLIENAIQHAPAGSDVTVEATALPLDGGARWVECCVKDSGPGFAEEDLPHLFEPFFTRRRKGTGLGLAIVQRIVDEHRGRIEAGNRPEGGARICVHLPALTAGA